VTRAVIFDIGNVLIRWDPRLLYRQLLPGDVEVEAFFAEVDFPAWNLDLDRGLDWGAGVAALSARHPHRAELIRAFHDRWHETLPGEVEGARAVLDELAAAGVPLYAITNFSGRTWSETLLRFPFLADAFRDVVVSGHVGIVKPDPEIYRLCLARNGLVVEACTFVDDNAANVAAANALGLDAIRFSTAPVLRAELAARRLFD
jgi:2-haloacid dehalogenase